MRPGSPGAAFYPQVQPIQLAMAGLESSWHGSLFIAPDRSSTQMFVDDGDCHDKPVSERRGMSTGGRVAMDVNVNEVEFDRVLSARLMMPNGRRADQAVSDVRGKMTPAVLGSTGIPSSGLQGAKYAPSCPPSSRVILSSL